jgi:hypothetical protein
MPLRRKRTVAATGTENVLSAAGVTWALLDVTPSRGVSVPHSAKCCALIASREGAACRRRVAQRRRCAPFPVRLCARLILRVPQH